MNIAIIGGGIAGLMAAVAAQKANKLAKITLLEKSHQLGGLLAGIEYPEHDLYFDLGTHIFQETGDHEYDAELLNAVPASSLLHFPPRLGDLSGSVFNSYFQKNIHFPDIRKHPEHNELIASVRSHITTLKELPTLDRTSSLREAATERFGSTYAERVICPTLAHTFQRSADSLSAFALLLPGLTRTVIDNQDEWALNAKSSLYRAIAAIPDQRYLPAEMGHTRRSFYSRQKGSRAFIDGLAEKLTLAGVRIHTGAQINQLNLKTNRLIYQHDNKLEIITYDKLVIATGAIGAAHILKMDMSGYSFDRPMPHWLINLKLQQPCQSDLCYIYGLDKSCEWYRVTNYRAFSGDEKDCRLTVEIIGRDNLEGADVSKQLAEDLAERGIISSAELAFYATERLPVGFPSPTKNNIASLTQLGKQISQELPSNVRLCGVGSEGGLFFQNEVAPDAYWKAYQLTMGSL